jgi:hypothetical protein
MVIRKMDSVLDNFIRAKDRIVPASFDTIYRYRSLTLPCLLGLSLNHLRKN